jgi:hypothetical protein
MATSKRGWLPHWSDAPNHRIALTLPITGTIASPDIGIGPALNRTIGVVLKTVLPPTLVASMFANLAEGVAPSLDTIEFTPDSATLTEAHRRHADDVAKLAGQRPPSSLLICGRASAKDCAALEPKNQLEMRDAESRQPPRAEPELAPVALGASDEQTGAARVCRQPTACTHRLFERGGVDPARITECRSTFDPTDQGNPRAEVLF